jgi:hypothetical protein
MKRNGDGPRVTDSLILGHEDVGVAGPLNPRDARSGSPLDCQLTKLLDYVQDAMDHLIPRQPIPRRQRQQPASLPVLPPGRLHTRPLPPILEENKPEAGRNGLLPESTWTSTLLPSTAKSDPSGWQRFHRLVSLSGLGWAFVLVGVLWGLFALAFSQCDGCGWDKGELFFAWGLGILVFGFFLRTSRKRPALSRLFLAVNILMVSILSMVVATR